MDIATIAGIGLALVGIVGGLVMEGGKFSDILQHTAAIIVLGGTFGACMVSYPMNIVIAAFKGVIGIIKPPVGNPGPIIEQLVTFSNKARKEGIISLEGDAKAIEDPFFKKALMMAIDGADPKELRHTLEMQLNYIDEEGLVVPKVWEAAGGYAPTVGIIGAVMGLIQVMKNLENIEEVGHGIAVAFVATIYGVGFANILFLPAATKLTLLHKKSIVIKEMMIEGVVLVIEGINPMIMRDKLAGFFVEKIKGVQEAQK